MLTCEDVIQRTDAYKPNKVDVNMKMAWLYDIEQRIQTEIVDTHENSDELKNEIDHNDADTTKSLIADGRDAMYMWWLCSQIDLQNGDLDRYNMDSALFNEEYAAFRNAYNREHMPLAGPKMRY